LGAYVQGMRRGISVLAAGKGRFWIGYEDDLYEYHYDGTITHMKDMQGKPVVAKSLQQQLEWRPDSRLINKRRN
jgi:hypothetical protein